MSERAKSFQGPKGTRDFYPEDALRRRYLTETFRRVATLHGFEEIDGPTFEELELYTVKSGEGIVSELFSFQRAGGEDVYALRPEWTPTGARLYGARARQLQQPTKWFQIGPRFRAERPQRGRLREFLQWDCDVYGDDGTPEMRARVDAELAGVCVDALRALGLSERDVQVRISHRGLVQQALIQTGVAQDRVDEALVLLDRRSKLPEPAFQQAAHDIGLDLAWFDERLRTLADDFERGVDVKQASLSSIPHGAQVYDYRSSGIYELRDRLAASGAMRWCKLDFSIVRGLAYYTGMVFEVVAEGERAVAGGGRYDKLVGLLGGPDAPAVGFAMGDVVVSLLLEDKGLMPSGTQLMEAASLPPASARPEVFVISADEEQGEPLVDPLVANLRRGIPGEGEHAPWSPDRYKVRPLHARRSYKTTKNLKKLLADAERQGARFAAIVHRAEVVQLKDLDRREDLGDFYVSPETSEYVGTVVQQRLRR